MDHKLIFSETREATPTKIGEHACYINAYLHEFFELIPILQKKKNEQNLGNQWGHALFLVWKIYIIFADAILSLHQNWGNYLFIITLKFKYL